MVGAAGKTTCETCRQKYQELLQVPFYAPYTPLAVVGDCPKHGLFFRTPSSLDLDRLRQADSQRQQLDWQPVDDFLIENGPKSGDLVARNIRPYL